MGNRISSMVKGMDMEQAGSTIAMGKKHIAMGEENLQ